MTVIELTPNLKPQTHTVMSQLPSGTVQSSHVHYATISAEDSLEGNGASAHPSESSFYLGESDDPMPPGVMAADLLIIPRAMSDCENVEKVLNRLVSLGKPDAALILEVKKDFDQLTSVLKTKEFQCVVDAEHSVALFKRQVSQPTNGSTDCTSAQCDVTIVDSLAPTEDTNAFSKALQTSLEDQGYTTSVVTWTDIGACTETEFHGKTLVSLLELDTPMLSSLSEPDFLNFRKLVLNSERLLWVNAGDNPSMGVIDGIRRTMRSEVAGIKFQVLHLSSLKTALQCGPSLIRRIISTEAQDDEYRERNGMLEVARIYDSPEGNADVRHCLEDSVRVQRLADQAKSLRLTIGKPGLLDTLTFIEDDRMKTTLGETEIQVDIKATGIK